MSAPLRVVLDTNIVLSALVFGGGAAGRLRVAWQQGALLPLASLMPLASSLSPATAKTASDFWPPVRTDSLPHMPVGAIGFPWSST